MKVQFRTRFSEALSDKQTGISFDPAEGMTKGSFKDECDINHIMARYKRTGQLPDMVREDGSYGEFADVPTYLEAMEIVVKAQEQFAALPAAVRAECANSPELFLERLKDPEWARKHELALPPKADAIVAPEPAQGAPSPKGGQTQPGKAKAKADTGSDAE